VVVKTRGLGRGNAEVLTKHDARLTAVGPLTAEPSSDGPHRMKRIAVPLTLVLLGLVAALIAYTFNVDRSITDLIVIGTALTVGNLFELRPAHRVPLPMGFAVTLVLLRAATRAEFVAVVVLAAVVATALRRDASSVGGRPVYATELIAAGLVAGIAFRLTMDSFNASSRTGMFVALAAAGVLEIFVADLVSLARGRRLASIRERGADVAIVSSGILMAVGYGGLGGRGRLGLWGPALFCIPLLAAWYSFELLRRTRGTFIQTVHALGIAPELGSLAPVGHVERVANLAVAVARELGVSEGELRDLDTAAWLHHLGAVCLDEPAPGEVLDPAEVAQAGAEMLRSTQVLSSAGDIVASGPAPRRQPGGQESGTASSLLGQVLKVASAYDELTSGNDAGASRAIETLFSEPAYVYDARVLSALESVVLRRH
jgi:hypothetical protein